MGRKRSTFTESALMNNRTYGQYLARLTELAISMFEWKNLPDSIDARFLELTLFSDGHCVFFRDDDLRNTMEENDEGYLALQCACNGPFNVYRIPIKRRAFASNGYQKELTDEDSVIIYNNMIHTNSVLDVMQFATRLYNLDRIVDVNADAQKTPILLQGTEQQKLTLLNLYQQYDGNAPVIFGDKNLDLNSIKCISTQAPFVADRIYALKTMIWNEALTYLGISNMNIQKKERLITDEVTRNQGGTVSSRYSRLNARREACKQINKMFGLNIECNYREDFQQVEDGKLDSPTAGTDTIGEQGNE